MYVVFFNINFLALGLSVMSPAELVHPVELLAVCVEAARLASERIRSLIGTDLHCVEKGNGTDAITGRPMRDIQTEADRQCEQLIIETLLRYFPGLKIIGEEGGPISVDKRSPRDSIDKLVKAIGNGRLSNAKNIDNSMPMYHTSDLVVFVDPLDGTSDFVNGHLQCVSVLIGVAHRGHPMLGVIYRPFPDEKNCPDNCMYGGPLTGVFRDHLKMPQIPQQATIVSPVITTTKSKNHRIIDRIFELIPKSIVHKDGGAGWKCWLVAEQRVHAYQYARPGTKRWDILAGDAIITALGGLVTDACGRPIDYSPVYGPDWNNSWGILVSGHKEWHLSQLVAASRQALEEAVADPHQHQWPSGLSIPDQK